MKKLACLMAAVVVGFAASADALYWQVDLQNGASSSAPQSFDYATLWAKDSKGVSYKVTSIEASGNPSSVAPTLTDLGTYGSSTYSFYVELFNYGDKPKDDTSDDTSVYQQAYASTYNELLSAGYVSSGPMSTPASFLDGHVAYNGAAVPEPTSGLLLLVGGAMLALRRRRRA